MGRFAGKINTDVYGVQLSEIKLAHISLNATQAAAADPDGLVDGVALGEAATEVTTFGAQPPYPRNIIIEASDAQDGNAVVTGTNYAGDVISETIKFNGTTAVEGNLAFKTVTKIVLPIKTGTETVDIGWSDKLGLPFLLSRNTLLGAYLDNTLESTAAAVVADADELEKNTVDLNSALNGKAVDLYFMM